jgi:uncharacterized protein
MNFYENDPSGVAFVIQRASEHALVINGEAYTQTVVISAQGLTTWSISAVSELTPALLEPLAEDELELILIGTGVKMQLLDPQLLQLFYSRGIGVEMMDTPAAARTYNLLAQDGRALTAILIL